MPELPEVEVVRRGVDQWVVGRTISEIAVLHSRAVRRQVGDANEFVGRLKNRTVTKTDRRGKFMWLVLDDGQALVTHLGMSGQVLMQPLDAQPEIHLRIKVNFTDGDYAMHFVDQRTFGWMSVEDLVEDAHGQAVPECALHIALDPLNPQWNPFEVISTIGTKKSDIKRVILDQRVVSGIGNIYADEALWLAKVNWAIVMTQALAVGGTSFDALYVNVNGESGYFSRDLNAYGQEDQPCARCGTLIVRESFMNRSSFRCPACQPTA